MKRSLTRAAITVKRSKTHGYGVFATKTLKKGDVIEECYTLIGKGGDKALDDYYFDADGRYAIPTGFGIIYNHHTTPNAVYVIKPAQKLMIIKANQTIRKGDEIFVSYGDEWFKTRRMTPKDG